MSPVRSAAFVSFALVSLAACTSTPPPAPAPAPVAAAPASPPPPTDMKGQLQAMHDQLAITPRQEPIWDRFGQQLTSAYGKVTAMQAQKAQNASSMTVLQGMKAQQSMLAAQTASMHQLMPTAQKLYDSMTPDQRNKWSTMMSQGDSPTCGFNCYILRQQ